MRQPLRIIVFLIALLAFGAAIILLLSGWMRSRPSTIPTSLLDLLDPHAKLVEPVVEDVSASRGWQSTGILVDSGQKIKIQYLSGEIRDAESIIRGPAGAGYVCGDSDCCEPMPEAERGALIGRVGDFRFLIGDQNTVEVQEGGELQLRINDCDEGLFDNSGSFQIKISP